MGKKVCYYSDSGFLSCTFSCFCQNFLLSCYMTCFLLHGRATLAVLNSDLQKIVLSAENTALIVIVVVETGHEIVAISSSFFPITCAPIIWRKRSFDLHE